MNTPKLPTAVVTALGVTLAALNALAPYSSGWLAVAVSAVIAAVSAVLGVATHRVVARSMDEARSIGRASALQERKR